ncbi:hypothetical protein ACLQ2N_08455 [Streptomyces sp. DT224]|uniref:hypothetical protein n=1 Tax=Streptomyces sp. DT224 TaxID=3393426 RepID=UPI003CF9D20B
MNAHRVQAATGVILGALAGTDSSAAGVAAALEAAGLLQSPESATELEALRRRVAELEDDSRLLAALHAGGVDNWDGYEDACEVTS